MGRHQGTVSFRKKTCSNSGGGSPNGVDRIGLTELGIGRQSAPGALFDATEPDFVVPGGASALFASTPPPRRHHEVYLSRWPAACSLIPCRPAFSRASFADPPTWALATRARVCIGSEESRACLRPVGRCFEKGCECRRFRMLRCLRALRPRGAGSSQRAWKVARCARSTCVAHTLHSVSAGAQTECATAV